MIHKLPFSSNEFRALPGHLLLKTPVTDDEEKSSAGIVLGRKSVIERPCYGTVLSSGVKNIMPGDTVVYPATDGLDCTFNDEKGYVLLKADSLIGIIKA